MAKLNKIDSNVTGLRYAEEDSYKVLPASPEWVPMEPNSYTDFGGQVTTVARNPINPARQRKKGVATDLDAQAGFDTDLTQTNLADMLQGFFFADLRRKADVGVGRSPRGQGILGADDDYTVTDIDGANTVTVDSRVAVSAVVVAAGTGYAEGDIVEVTDANATVLARFVVTGETGGLVDTVALTHTVGTTVFNGIEGRTHTDTGAGAVTTKITGSGDDALTLTLTYGNGLTWQIGDMVFMTDNDDAANNGLKTVSATTDNAFTTDQTLVLDATPAAASTVTTVGFEGATTDIDVDVTGALPALTSTALDFTTLGLVEGEWIYVGGDVALSSFVGANNNGFKRIRSIAATTLTLDKSVLAMTAETGTGLDLRIFMGRVLKNELGALIKRRSYNLERTLGVPDDSFPAQEQAEYVIGAVPNEFTFNIPVADKLMADLTFVGADHETKDGPTSLKTGSRPVLVESDAFNTSSDIPRVKMALASSTDEAPTALFAFVTDLTVVINNGITPNKAVGVFGAFEATAGTFEVSGALEAYFSDVTALAAVRDNSDISLDVHLVKSNAGMSIDLPLIALGDGRPNVEQDEPIKLPLTMDAATAAKIDPNFDYTLLMMFWDYLPTVAG